MPRKKRDRIELGEAGGLTHSPFASLRGTGTGAGSDSVSVPAEGPGPGPADSADAPSAGAAGRIEVRRERKGRGGKTVTVLRWLDAPPAADELGALARTLAAALGAGARVEGTGAIVVQGDQVDRAARALSADGRVERIVRGTDGR